MRKRRRVIVFWILLVAFCLWAGARLVNAISSPRHLLGARDGQLAACPDKPNCVSTQADDAAQKMDTLPVRKSPAAALQRLRGILQRMPRSRVVTTEEDYLHAEFRSRLLGFVDDVEFLVDDAGQVIHFRSAARLGYSDLGTNRKRMESIREAFLADQGG